MNKNFKVIFNHARGCLVVANECAKSFGKSKKTVNTSLTIAAGLVSLALMNPVVATEGGSGSKDIVGEGSSITNSNLSNATEQTKVIGGFNLSNGKHPETINTSVVIDQQITLDEIIGGSHAKTQHQNDKLLLTAESSTLNVANVTADIIVGGSKNNNSNNVNLSTDKIKNTLSNVTVEKDFVGGNLLKATGQVAGGPATAEGRTHSIENNVLSGKFNGRFVGGSMAENYGKNPNTGTLKVSDQTIVTNISGGDFSKVLDLFGGALATGKGTQAFVDSSVLKITGGDFNSGKFNGTQSRNWIFAGSASVDGGGEIVHRNSTLILDGSSGNFVSSQGSNLKNQTYGEFYGGGFNSSVSEKISVSVENMNLGFIDQNETRKGTMNKAMIYAGSRISSLKDTELFEGDIHLRVNNSTVIGDAVGAGFVWGSTDFKLSTGNTVVEIRDSYFDGFTQDGNRYSGKVIGAGRMEEATNSTFLVKSSSVHIHNMSGFDVEQGSVGTITHDPGTQVIGGVQTWHNTNSLAHVNQTYVYIDGSKTSIMEVMGGGLISGNNSSNGSTLSTGDAYVEVAEGNVSGFLVGGNQTNWFGVSVIGNLDKENGTFVQNGNKYSEGSSTAVLSGGGNKDTLHVIGGSWTNFSADIDYVSKRESYVVGKSTALIRGGQANIVNGGGYAVFAIEQDSIKKPNRGAPISNVIGDSYAIVESGEISSYLIGGGHAKTTHKEFATVANVEGNSYVLISGGNVKNVIGGGFAQGNGATADVTGSSFVTIAGGKISGNIYAGGFAEEGNKANVGGTATVTFLADIGFEGTVDGSNAKSSVLAFGDDSSVFNANFAGTFKNFDEVKAAQGSRVSFKEIGNDQFKAGENGSAKLKLTGKGIVETEKFSLNSGQTLEVLSGSFIASSAELNGGMLYLDPAWNEEPSLGAIENPGEIKSHIVVGQNSALTLGSKDTQLALTALKQSGHNLAENDTKSVVYVASPVSLNGGNTILVDGTVEDNSDALNSNLPGAGVFVKKDSALIVNGETEGSSINGTEGHKFITDAGSKVIVHNAIAGKNVSIASGFGNMKIEEGTTYETTNRVLGLDKISVDENGELVVGVNSDLSVISNVLMPNTVLAAVSGEKGIGVDRINGLLSVYNGLEDEEVEKALNSIALMGVAGGAQTIAVNTADMIQDTLNLHGSKLASYDHEKAGPDLWIDVNGSFSKANDYSVGIAKYGYKSDLTGVTIGGDYALGNGVAAGLAVSLGKGSVRGQGNGSGVKNDIDYYGINLYGVANTRFVNLIGTIGYLQSKNEIKQMGFKGKPDAKTFSIGVRAEKPLALNDRITVTPHIGVKYVHTKLDSFSAGGLTYKADKANLVQVPFGVAFNANLEAPCGAKVKPFIDLTIAPNFGDKKVTNKVGLVTTGTLDSFDARITNNAMYKGKVGVETTKGKHSFGLNYGIGGGNRGRVDQTLQANYRYQF